MTLLGILPPAILLLVCLAYIFRANPELDSGQRKKTQIEHLHDRLEVVYDNLRDLNFEFRAGKYPQADYDLQRSSLETEAADLLTRIEQLEVTSKRKLTA